MYGFLLVLAVAFWTIWKPVTLAEQTQDLPQKISARLDKLLDIARESFKDHKYIRAEKALLTILRVDETNATAYNRLGILYAKQKSYSDAIECFEIAQSLEPNASSLHNVGLIYYETGNYEKSALAFEQAIAIESEVASRHIAYAKSLDKLGDYKGSVKSLETAVRIEPSLQAFNILADAYHTVGEVEKAEKISQLVKRALNSRAATSKTVKQVRKVML